MQDSAGIRNAFRQGIDEENGYSGKYTPAFSNKLHPCSVLVEINNVA